MKYAPMIHMIHRHLIRTPLAIAACAIATAAVSTAQSITIPTSFGDGADTNIRGGTNTSENTGGATSIQATLYNSGTNDNRRLIYLKFDLSGVTPSLWSAATSAQLDMFTSFNSPVGDTTIRVYGLNDSENADGWGELTINATNAPGILNPTTMLLDLPLLTDLGSFVSDQGTSGNGAGWGNAFSSVALLDFLKTDTDNLVTFIVVQESFAEGASGNFGIRTKEHTDPSLVPTLTIGSGSVYYWDSNNDALGFGDTNGTWSATTTGTPTSGWTTDSTGLEVVDGNSVTTRLFDTVNFGTPANPYGTTGNKTITVSGTVNAGTVVFENTGAFAVTLNGGAANFGDVGVITNNSNAGFTWNSAITGAGTSLTIDGTAGQSVTNVFNNAFSGTSTITIGSDIRFDQNVFQTDGAGLTYNVLGNLGLRDTAADEVETTYQIGELTGSGFISAGGAANDGRRVIVGAKNTDSTFNGLIRFSALGFTKEGTGTLTLTNAEAHNYGRSTVISGGILQLGDGGSIGGLSNTSEIINNAVLIYNHSNSFDVSRTMTGTGSLEKKGDGILTLTGANSYSGDTTVSEGTLSLIAANPNTESSTVTIAATGATLNLNFAGTVTVEKLFIGYTPKLPGVYGAEGSPAPVIGIPQITGTGTLTVTSSHPEYTLLLDETFLNGERTTENLPTTAAWYGSNNSLDQIAAGSIRSTLTGSTQHVFTHFTPLESPYSLLVGEKITLSFDFNLTKAITAGSGIRLGLLDSGGTRITNDTIGTANANYADDVGYGLFINPVNIHTGGLGVVGRVTAPGINGLINQVAAWTSYTSVNNPLSMADAQTYSLSLSVKRTETGAEIRGALSGGNLEGPVNFSYNHESEEAFIAFDKFAIGVLGDATSGTVEDPAYLTLSNVEIFAGYDLGYSSWASLNGAGPNLDGDHDGDGVSNGVEYFLGGPNGYTTGFTPLPEVIDTGGTLTITWTKAADYAGTYGTDFWVETSETLADPWTPENEGVTVTIIGDDVTYTFPNPLGTKKFARLRVTGP